MSPDLSLYLVTDSGVTQRSGHDLVDLVREAVDNGVTCVQIREKDASAREFLHTVLRVADGVGGRAALLVNDRVDVYLAARQMGAAVHGVHVGQTDLPAEAVREMIGPDAVLGLSAQTEESIRRAAASPARIDYIGLGALHATQTKKNPPPPLGHARFAELVGMSELPVVGIGGVKLADMAGLKGSGAAGAAVVTAICAAPEPGLAARELRQAWDSAR